MCHFLILFIALLCSRTNAQNTVALGAASIKIALPKGSGTNAAGVAYNPQTGYYYMAMAGNADYPLYVYNKRWTLVAEVTGDVDFRSIWYNPTTKQLEGNGYNEEAIYVITLNDKGIPTGAKKTEVDVPAGLELNTSWAYNAASKQVMVYDDGKESIIIYDRKKGTKKKSILLRPSVPAKSVNYTTALYTGMKGKEIAIGNYVENTLWLYDAKTGKKTETVKVATTSTPMKDRFNLAWCNNTVWLFNTDERTWYGFEYK